MFPWVGYEDMVFDSTRCGLVPFTKHMKGFEVNSLEWLERMDDT